MGEETRMRYGTNPVLITILRRSVDASSVRGDYAPVGQPLMGSQIQRKGRSIAEAGLPEDAVDLVIRVPHTAVTAAITIEDRLAIRGSEYTIGSVGLPERHGGFVNIACMRSLGH